MFTLRTFMKLTLLRPSRVYIFEKPPSICRMSLYKSNVCHSVVKMVEGVGVPRPNKAQGPWSKKSAEFLLHMLKNAE